MNQPEQQTNLVPIQPQQLVEVEGKVYQITQVTPHPMQPQPPQYIQAHPVQQQVASQFPLKSSIWEDQTAVILMGISCIVLGGAIAWVITKVIVPPVPVAAPTQPQTVIVQPPQPEKKPYTREECRPAGLFGWGQDCYRERGYQ